MRKHDRRRHVFGRLVTGVTKHDALVASALLGCVFALSGRRVDSLGNVRTLPRQVIIDEDVVSMKNWIVVGVLIADIADRRTYHLIVIKLGRSGDLARHRNHIALHQRFAGHPALRVLGQTRIQDAVGNIICHLVRVPFTNGFGTEFECNAHSAAQFARLSSGRKQKSSLYKDIMMRSSLDRAPPLPKR